MQTRHLLLTALLLGTSVAAGCNSSDAIAVPVVTTVSLSLAADSLEIGQPNTANAVALDQSGDTLTFAPTFSSSVPTVVGINPFTGAMIALSPGTSEITATFGLRTARKTVTVIASPIRVNEVKPNGEGPGGWVELFNTSDAPVNVGNWKITTTTHALAFVIPAGVTIAPHGFFTIEEADFPEGLKSVDEVHFFNGFGKEVDSFAWPVNPTTSFGRCPEGTGPFVTNVSPSKTRANVCPVVTQP